MNVGDWENVEDLRQEILNLLGIKHVPSKKAPHFYSHLGNKTVIRTFCITSSMNFLNVNFFSDEPLHDEHFSLDHRERGRCFESQLEWTWVWWTTQRSVPFFGYKHQSKSIFAKLLLLLRRCYSPNPICYQSYKKLQYILLVVSSPRTTLHFSYFTSDSQVVRHSIRRKPHLL